jgi:hypothetical protein
MVQVKVRWIVATHIIRGVMVISRQGRVPLHNYDFSLYNQFFARYIIIKVILEVDYHRMEQR